MGLEERFLPFSLFRRPHVPPLCLPATVDTQMGPSGSGKTTLMDILSGRKTTGSTSGAVLFGRYPPSRALLRRYCGYCEQQGGEGGGERGKG